MLQQLLLARDCNSFFCWPSKHSQIYGLRLNYWPVCLLGYISSSCWLRVTDIPEEMTSWFPLIPEADPNLQWGLLMQKLLYFSTSFCTTHLPFSEAKHFISPPICHFIFSWMLFSSFLSHALILSCLRLPDVLGITSEAVPVATVSPNLSSTTGQDSWESNSAHTLFFFSLSLLS